MAQLVQAVQGGHLICLGQRGEVEDVVDEELDGAVEGHYGLADVDEFCGACADGVDAQDGEIFLVDEELEHAGVVAE